MKRRMYQWAAFSGLSILVALVGFLFFDRQMTSLLEPLLEPWHRLCLLLTPDAWEARGNILLGMGWLISGVLVHGALLGGIVTAVVALCERTKTWAVGRKAGS